MGRWSGEEGLPLRFHTRFHTSACSSTHASTSSVAQQHATFCPLPQVRYERVQQELLRLRAAAGQEAHLPDFDTEEALREALAATEARKAQVGVWVGRQCDAVGALRPYAPCCGCNLNCMPILLPACHLTAPPHSWRRSLSS